MLLFLYLGSVSSVHSVKSVKESNFAKIIKSSRKFTRKNDFWSSPSEMHIFSYSDPFFMRLFCYKLFQPNRVIEKSFHDFVFTSKMLIALSNYIKRGRKWKSITFYVKKDSEIIKQTALAKLKLEIRQRSKKAWQIDSLFS